MIWGGDDTESLFDEETDGSEPEEGPDDEDVGGDDSTGLRESSRFVSEYTPQRCITSQPNEAQSNEENTKDRETFHRPRLATPNSELAQGKKEKSHKITYSNRDGGEEDERISKAPADSVEKTASALKETANGRAVLGGRAVGVSESSNPSRRYTNQRGTQSMRQTDIRKILRRLAE